jgi:hypothetical protein
MTTNQTAQASRNTWLWLGLLLAVAVALAIWLMPRPTTGTSEAAPPAAQGNEPATAAPAPAPKEQPAPKAEAKPVADDKATEQAQPSTPAPVAKESDMFAEPMPDFMVDLHAKVLDKKWLNAPQQKQLYEYGKEHRDDARPQLILAWDALNRDWDGIATDMYRIAYRADKRAKDDPNMLKDLLRVAGAHQDQTVEFTDTAELVQKAYGVDALPKIETEIAESRLRGEQTKSDRLSKLREYIRSR